MIGKISAASVAMIVLLAGLTIHADEPAAGGKLKLRDLNLEVPAKWKQQQPSSSMRLAQFAVTPVEGELDPAEVTVFPPMGGSVAENIKRWIDQFQSTGRTSKITKGKFPGGEYVLLEVSGTFNKPDGPIMMQKTKPAPEYKMLAAMLITDKGNYFIKMPGPIKTIDANAENFRKLFGGDITKEEAYSL